MKIKTQFYLLIGGILLVPLLTAAAQYLFMRVSMDEKQVTTPAYEEIAPFLGDGVSDRTWQILSRYIQQTRPGSEIAVFRDDLMVIYSTIHNFKPGQIASGRDIFSLMRQTDQRYSYAFDSPPFFNNRHFYVMRRHDNVQDKRPPLNPMMMFVSFSRNAIGIMLLFIIIMTVVIARSITRSVMVLEQATKRIARGEFDLELNVTGSNEITSLTASLNQMRLALKEEELRRSRFIMGISHDLKTPLALIKGYAEAIEDGIAENKQDLQQQAAIITTKVDQLDGMINELINFVRVDTREWQETFTPVKLKPFIQKFAERAEADAELLKRSVTVDMDIDDDCTVPMAEHLVLRALENLVNNSMRYTSEGGRITLTVREEEGGVSIAVSDNGQGIGPADLSHVFELFYRGSSSRREQGMGLGLAVVKGVIDSHGWTISAASGGPGLGSTFTIFVPLHKYTDNSL